MFILFLGVCLKSALSKVLGFGIVGGSLLGNKKIIDENYI